jgi:hypothetical protein
VLIQTVFRRVDAKNRATAIVRAKEQAERENLEQAMTVLSFDAKRQSLGQPCPDFNEALWTQRHAGNLEA